MPDKDENTKEILKEALKEWMDEKFAQFGRWTFYGLLVGGFGGLVYLLLIAEGWHKG